MNNYYIIIPSFVIQNENLKQVDSLTYGHIKRYVDMRECIASNEHLAKEIGITTRCLKDSLHRLDKYNFISRRVIYKEGTKQIIKRIITLVDQYTSINSVQNHDLSTETVGNPVDNVTPLGAKFSPTLGEKFSPGNKQSNNIQRKEKKEKKESLACARSKAARPSLSKKQADVIASKSVKKHNTTDCTITTHRRSHASTNVAKVSFLADELHYKIKQAQESDNSASALKHLLL